MIVVLGRPGLSVTGRSDVTPAGSADLGLAGRAARIALAARAAGAAVELVGSVGDDPDGDQVIIRLGHASIGHSAVLRDPSARTPIGEGAGGDARGGAPGAEGPGTPLPRLEPADISLGLSYVTECRVLVIAEALPAEALAVAAEAAAYHGAAIVAIVDEGSRAADGLPAGATLLEAPSEEPADAAAEAAAGDDDQAAAEAAARSDTFDGLVAQYAVALDRGEDPGQAFHAASGAAGWEAVRS